MICTGKSGPEILIKGETKKMKILFGTELKTKSTHLFWQIL